MCQFLTSELQRSEPGVSCTFWLASVLVATAACHFSTSELPKVVRTVLDILTCKCASRYSGAQFFDIWTSQKPVSFLAFWLANVLLATAACHFPASDLQKVVRTHPFFSILTWTWKCASRQSSVRIFMSQRNSYTCAPAALASLLFDPPEPQIMRKTKLS